MAVSLYTPVYICHFTTLAKRPRRQIAACQRSLHCILIRMSNKNYSMSALRLQVMVYKEGIYYSVKMLREAFAAVVRSIQVEDSAELEFSLETRETR